MMIQLLFYLLLLGFLGGSSTAQPAGNTQQRTVTASPPTQAAIDTAVAEARARNRHYWRQIKWVLLGTLILAWVLLRLRTTKKPPQRPVT